MSRWSARRPAIGPHEGTLTSLDGIVRRLNLHGIRQRLEKSVMGGSGDWGGIVADSFDSEKIVRLINSNVLCRVRLCRDNQNSTITRTAVRLLETKLKAM